MKDSKPAFMRREVTLPAWVLAALVAVLAALVVVCATTAQKPQSAPRNDTFAVIATDDAVISDYSTTLSWITNPARNVVLNEWDDETGRYAWFTNPMREQGITADDILQFLDTLEQVAANVN